MNFSITKLKTLFSCPYQYYKKYEVPRAERDEKDTIPRILGIAVHKTIEQDVEQVSDEDLVQLFQNEFLHGMSRTNLMVKPYDSVPSAMKRGKKMVLNYRQLLPQLAGKKVKREWGLKFDFYGYRILGKIDRAADDRLYDFKTGKYEPYPEFLSHDLQFAFYRLGFIDSFGLEPEMFWVALETGNILPVVLHDMYTDDLLLEYLSYAEGLIESCRDSGFYPPTAKHGLSTTCNNCGFKHECVS